MSDRQQTRAEQLLRVAERRLAEAERAQINVASSSFGGHAGGPGDGLQATRNLNKKIAEATDLDGLRREVADLRAQLKANRGE